MSDEMKPALTADEWRDFLDPANKEWAPLAYHNLSDHAAAATGLFGRPFGFTKDDLIGLCALSQKFDQETQVFLGYRNVDRAEFLRSLADRIAALLPPEP